MTPQQSAVDFELGTRIDDVLADALRSVVGEAAMGADTRFSDLGGDSLRAVRVLSACWRALGVELPLHALKPGTRMAEFRRLLHDAVAQNGDEQADEQDHHVERIARQEPGTSVPLPPNLESLYSFYRVDPGSAAYNVPLVLRFDAAGTGVGEARLHSALHAVAVHHTALRTVFTVEDGQAAGSVRPEPHIDWDSVDLTGSAGPESEAERVVHDVAREPLDLERTPVRARLIHVHKGCSMLVLVLHHIVCDEWSLRVLVQDLLDFLRSPAVRGPAEERPLGALDVAAWERDRLCERRRDELAEHWRRALDGTAEVLELPTDRPRPGTRSFRGARLPVRLDSNLVRALTACAHNAGTTLFTALAAGCSLTLRRYTGQDDFVLGFPVAGRVRPEFERVLGYLTKTVPLRVRLDDQPSVRTLLGRLHDGIAEAQEHAELPLETIAEAAGIPRLAGTPALIQCALVLFSEQHQPIPPEGVGVEVDERGTDTAKFDLNWYLEERGGELAGYVEFATDLFDPATVEQIHRHFMRLLHELTAADQRDTAAWLPMLTGSEQAALLDQPDAGGAADDEWESVHRMVERQAVARPDHPALWCAGVSVTYAEMNARANALARALCARGIGAEDLVGIHLRRSPEQMVAVLAVLKAGAAYLPLDPTYPHERLSGMAADAGLSAVVAVDGRTTFSTAAERVIDVATGADDPDSENPDVPTTAGQLAYVIYTSGTTGRPKGVQITHRSLANVIRASGRDFAIDETTRVLQVVSFSFDASVWEIFMALASGATLCLGPPDVAHAERSIEEVIRESGATLVYLPPALLSLVDPSAVPQVRVVITGGDLITPELRRTWTERCRFFVAYGPTEGTIVQTWQEHRETGAALPIGRPFAGVRLYVLDDELSPVPEGAVGEVYVGGLAVSRGYRGLPGLTARAYLPDPYADLPGARMYRTGDRVRRLRGGELTFVGRTDHQVKIRGYRIEPAEVEAALSSINGVEAAVVTAESGPNGRAQLVAYVVAPGHTTAERLRDGLRPQLPEHMVPTRIHRVPTIPLTVNGKVDRVALPALADVDDDSLAQLLDVVENSSSPDAERSP